MSKAFTSEETADPASVAREPPRLRPGEVRYVTPEGHAALRAELERVREEQAGASGLGEAEREARAADLARRADLLEGTLAALTVLGPDAAPPGRAGFGCWVTVDDEEGRRTRWRLVGPDEAAPRRGLVSVHSPVGRALLGRAEGDVAEVERPDGARHYTVVAIAQHA